MFLCVQVLPAGHGTVKIESPFTLVSPTLLIFFVSHLHREWSNMLSYTSYSPYLHHTNKHTTQNILYFLPKF